LFSFFLDEEVSLGFRVVVERELLGQDNKDHDDGWGAGVRCVSHLVAVLYYTQREGNCQDQADDQMWKVRHAHEGDGVEVEHPIDKDLLLSHL